ncbi:MAG: hypothetical protein ACJAW7_002890 [Candidatus Azotimanducaceae bacterium]|jgi:hypothetical protein
MLFNVMKPKRYCWVSGLLPVEEAPLLVAIVEVKSDEYRGKSKVKIYTKAKR